MTEIKDKGFFKKDKYELGIIITLFNRPQYTKQFFESLSKAFIDNHWLIVLIDDHSTDHEAIALFNDFDLKGIKIIKQRNAITQGIQKSLQIGFDLCFKEGCGVAMNFDNDCLIKKDGIQTILSLQKTFVHQIITGFNCNTKNRDGSERHKKITEFTTWTERKSVGGINMCFSKDVYEKYVSPALKIKGNWDHNTCINSEKDGKRIVCTRPSVVQHIGFNSSLNHSNEEIDMADDFMMNDLKRLNNVTLIGVDCISWQRLEDAALQCLQGMRFGAVKMLTSLTTSHPINDEVRGVRHWVNIPLIRNKVEYSNFMMRKLYDYIDTEFALVFQYDGYILDSTKWKDEWSQYDYIGATWIYKNNQNVGNGGFSLRSKKLLKILKEDKKIIHLHPEDEMICRTYRKYLEDTYQIKFAPEEIANQFSIEAYGSNILPGANKYSGQFGFHGYGVDFSTSNLAHKPQIRRR